MERWKIKKESSVFLLVVFIFIPGWRFQFFVKVFKSSF